MSLYDPILGTYFPNAYATLFGWSATRMRLEIPPDPEDSPARLFCLGFVDFVHLPPTYLCRLFSP